MNARPEKIETVHAWVQRAESDFRNAEHTLKMSPEDCPYDTVCFHAQQIQSEELGRRSRKPKKQATIGGSLIYEIRRLFLALFLMGRPRHADAEEAQGAQRKG